MAAESVLGRKQTDPPPQGNDIKSSTDDLFQMRECSGNKVIRLTNGYKQPAEFTGDKRMNHDKLGSLVRRDGSYPEQTGDSVISHTSPETSVMRRHGAWVLTTRTPPARILRADITINEERDRVFVERGYKKQGQASKTRPSRRMSCPENVSNNFSNERSRSFTKAMPKRKTRLCAQQKHHLEVKTDDRSPYVLPKIIESIETLWTKEENESSGNERNDDMRSSKSSSPRSFNSEKSADEVKLGSNDSKINVLMSSLVTKSEGNSNGHKEISAYKNKAIETTFHAKQDIVASRFLDSSPIQNSIEDTRKIKIEGKQICDIDRIHFNASENGLRTRAGGGMQSTKRKTMIIPQRGVKFRPKSRTTSGKDLANQKAPSPTISEEELNLKVLTFLRSNQPMASPETLKLKVAKRTKTILPSNSMPDERRKGGVFINTDTCPSTSHLITQNRSWYYQDRRGKCRYLRLPESPVPPIEWVFQRDDTF